MHKWIGALLVFGSVVVCGTYPIYCKSCRLRLLMELIGALEKMKVELHSNAPTLPCLMESMVLCANGKAKHFFEALHKAMREKGAMEFYDEWKRQARKELQHLTYQERAEVLCLGDTLGCYLIEDQVERIDRTLSVLREGAFSTKAYIRERLKLYLGTSVSMGMLAVIVLL